MNLEKLKQAEGLFLSKYPSGFLHPDLQAIGKKHKMDKMVELAQQTLKKTHFKDPLTAAEAMSKVISRSSMVSLFEKPKFRDIIPTLEPASLKQLTGGMKQFLYGNQQKGFDDMLNVLAPVKLAKWSLMTIIPNYVHPEDEVFLKPTTVKGVIKAFELNGLEYRPLPSWDFYQRYRDTILEMKTQVDETLSPSNAAFCGFLMMSM